MLFVEEPTSPDDVLGFAKIKEVGDVRLATGEACGGRIMFKQFLESGAMNVCQIDSCRLGSINEINVLLMGINLKFCFSSCWSRFMRIRSTFMYG